MRYDLVNAKTLLSKRIDGDSWFHSNHSMNLYRGCQFACAYCDGMSEYYHIDNYTTHIRVKENAPQVLRKELQKLGYIKKPKSLHDFTDAKGVESRKPIIGVSGGVSDHYKQAEKEFKITRKVLEVLREYGLPVFLLTKSDLILRDIELLKEIHELAHVNVNFSIAFADEEMKQRFEPNSPSIHARLDALKTLRQAGIHGGVIGLPVVPYVADSIDMLKELVRSVKAVNSEFLLLGGMTLKPGRQKQHFLKVIKRHYPDKVQQIHDMYSNDNMYGQPKNHKAINSFLLGPTLCEEQELRWLSIRHPSIGDYEDNSRLLKALLETVFIRSALLREPKTKWGPYHSIAVKVEKGLPPIEEVLDTPEMTQIEQISPTLIPELRDMASNGTSPELYELKKRVLTKSQRLVETFS